MMKIALVCSHGGHLSEMLYLLDAFKGHEIFFITYDNPRTRNLGHRKYLFPNFGENYFEVIKNLHKIIGILLKENPDIIVSNGSEIAVPFFYVGKLLRKKLAFIECYTRINMPTVTGKLVYPISDLFLVMWPEMLENYGKKAKYFGGLFDIVKAEKKVETTKNGDNNILVIVGMHYQGFERLVKKMDEIAGKISDKVIMQIGKTDYEPKNAEYFRFKELDSEIEALMKNAKVVLCQGAMTIIDSLFQGTPVIAVPRLLKYNEHLNDHQLIFSRKLEFMGLVSVVENIDNLDNILPKFKWNDKTKIITNKHLIEKIKTFIEKCNNDGKMDIQG